MFASWPDNVIALALAAAVSTSVTVVLGAYASFPDESPGPLYHAIALVCAVLSSAALGAFTERTLARLCEHKTKQSVFAHDGKLASAS